MSRDTHPELPIDPDAVQDRIYKWPPHFTPALIGVVFIGGGFGTLARYAVAHVLRGQNNGWPIATFIVNMLGALILGFLLEALARHGSDMGRRRILRLGLGTGFCGGFTTYSTLAVETVLLIKNDHTAMAAWYALVSLAGGLIFCALGIQAAAMRYKQKGKLT